MTNDDTTLHADNLLGEENAHESTENGSVKRNRFGRPTFKRIMTLLGSVLAALFILGFVVQLTHNITESNQTKELYSQATETVDTWMDGFADVGNSTIRFNANKADDSSQSYAMAELKHDLEILRVPSNGEYLTLTGMTLEIEKGKTYSLIDEEGVEVANQDGIVAKKPAPKDNLH